MTLPSPTERRLVSVTRRASAQRGIGEIQLLGYRPTVSRAAPRVARRRASGHKVTLAGASWTTVNGQEPVD